MLIGDPGLALLYALNKKAQYLSMETRLVSNY